MHARPWRGYRRVPRAPHARGRVLDQRVPMPRKSALPRELHGHGGPRDRVPRAPRNRVELLFGMSRNPALRGTQILEIPRRSRGPLRPRRAHRLFALGPYYLPRSVWGMQPVQAVLADQGRLQTTSTGATGPPTVRPQTPHRSLRRHVSVASVMCRSILVRHIEIRPHFGYSYLLLTPLFTYIVTVHYGFMYVCMYVCRCIDICEMGGDNGRYDPCVGRVGRGVLP